MKTLFVCQNCSYQSPKWLGQCPECLSWGTLEEEVIASTKEKNKNIVLKGSVTKPMALSDVEVKKLDRISTGLNELDRVLGGNSGSQGFVKGQVVLLGGEPGIGKSTIALEIVFKGVSRNLVPLYVSGEESSAQILLRAQRMLRGSDKGILSKTEVLNEYNVEKILFTMEQKRYDIVIIDSIQTVFSDESASMPGTVSQIRIAASKLANYAKNNDVVLILIGQVTKEGSFAGPKLLEHMVDTVLYMEGEPETGLRILKTVKNRFGSANEIGIFEMTETGLKDVSNYASLFLQEDTKNEIGVCKSVVIEGNRFFLIQVQALVDPTPYGLPKRVAEGISLSRLQRICAIVSKYLKINLRNSDVYVKIAGGMKFNDPALDLAVALAILSSVKLAPLSSGAVAFGELNLTGTVSKVLRGADRLKEASRLGYNECVSADKVTNLKEVNKYVKI
ncbi:DNA repair protein RadA [Candidatus Dojkabacteria bacterium]|nr:DNA repair protein RadA [Candidatus Dojkabacteria bacterium]